MKSPEQWKKELPAHPYCVEWIGEVQEDAIRSFKTALAGHLWTESEIGSARNHEDLAWMNFDNACDVVLVIDGEYKDRRYLVSWKTNGIFLKSPRGENCTTHSQSHEH